MRALITGVAGMDGALLAGLLVESGDDVFGMVRDIDRPRPRLDRYADDIDLVVGDLLDRNSIEECLRTAAPDIVYHLAAMSSPAQAWRMPELCAEVTGVGTARLLQAVEQVDNSVRVVVAGSIASHGPYGAAKTYARAMAADARARGLDVVTVLMGGHQDPTRSPSYLSAKVARHVARVLSGSGSPRTLVHGLLEHGSLELGSLGREQDWGWAPDFMDVWARRTAVVEAGEYTLSTNDPHTVQEYVTRAYELHGLDWTQWTRSAPAGSAAHPFDVPQLTAEPSPMLWFEPSIDFDELIRRMVAGQ